MHVLGYKYRYFGRRVNDINIILASMPFFLLLQYVVAVLEPAGKQ